MATPRAGTFALLLGALIGVVVAATGLVQEGEPAPSAAPEPLPEDAVARVNGRLIGRAEYERALRALRADPRGVERAEERALDRLIDEELLVQRGLELDLALRDIQVRANIASAVIQHIVTAAEARVGDPDEATLRAFYDDNPHRFRAPDQLWVRQRAYASEAQAHLAYERLRAQTPFDALPPGDDASVPVPDGLLPAAKLRDYLGPTATRAALALPEGGFTEVIRSSSGYVIVQVVERKDGARMPFEESLPWVRQSYRRHVGDAALRDVLEERRERAEIQLGEGLP